MQVGQKGGGGPYVPIALGLFVRYATFVRLWTARSNR